MRTICCRYFMILFLPFLFQGCLDTSESPFEQEVRIADEAMQAYLTKNNIEAAKQKSGVYIEILKENEGGKQLVENHVAGILYTISHLEGEYEIESHSDSLNPLRFSNSISSNRYSIHPAGLNIEIGKMRLGESFRFYIPSYQAFSNFGHEDFFDSHSHFIIDIDLIEIKTEDEIYFEEAEMIQNYIEVNQIDAEAYPNSLYHQILEEGTGNKPGISSQVEFHFTRKYLDGTIIETSKENDPITVYLNNNQLVKGLEDGLLLMREGEKANLIMPSRLAFGKSIQVIPQQLRQHWAENDDITPAAKPYSSLVYEIELLKVN